MTTCTVLLLSLVAGTEATYDVLSQIYTSPDAIHLQTVPDGVAVRRLGRVSLRALTYSGWYLSAARSQATADRLRMVL